MKITITNQKGGAGKSTLTLLLAETLKQHGSVLCVDCDPQGGITNLLDAPGGGLFELLTGGEFKPVTVRGLDLLTADHKLDKIAYTLPPYDLRDGINFDYDFILFDTPPTVQGISRAAAIAADKIIIPADISKTTIQPTLYTLQELRKVEKVGAVLLIGKEPGAEIKGFHADLYREFKAAIKENYSGTIPKTANAQKAAAGLSKIPKAISEILKGAVL